MIREDLFVSKMTSHWESLGNCPSAELQTVWQHLCHTFNEQIICDDPTWRVVQPETGTGKTQGLAMYAAMNVDHPNVGILIVVRLISQADEMMALINSLAGTDIARTRHSDCPMSKDEMEQTQVLIVTHAAYQLSLMKYHTESKDKFSSFMEYKENFTGSRQLVVIDESLDVVKEHQVGLEKLSLFLGAIPFEIRSNPDFEPKIQWLERLKSHMESAARENSSDRLFEDISVDTPSDFSLTALRETCRTVEWDERIYSRESLRDRTKIAQDIDRTLEAAEATLNSWHFYSRKGEFHTLNTSTLVIPNDIKGGVILDATAKQNLLYQLFGERVIIKPIVTARSYRNVTLHVAKIGGVGKWSMIKKAPQRVPLLLKDLNSGLTNDSKVLICCHKSVEHLFSAYDTPYQLSTAHWGAIDGLNCYQDHDTFVCFGLPYRDRIGATNAYFAFKGPQDNDWLRDSSKRRDLGYPDIREAINRGQVASDVIQAMNRIRSRRVIDEYGNCEPSNCYLVLGNDPLSDHILEDIRQAMPGIKVKDWEHPFLENAKKGRPKGIHRSNFVESLLVYLRGKGEGQWSATQLRKDLDIPITAWKELVRQIKDSGSLLYQKLTEISCVYVVEGSGRGARSHIIKSF